MVELLSTDTRMIIESVIEECAAVHQVYLQISM